MDLTADATEALAEVRPRLLGRSAADLDSIRQFVKAHPFWSTILGLLGVAIGGQELTDRLAPLLRAEQNAVTVTEAMLAFTRLGWAISSQVPVDGYRAILAMRAAGASDSELDEALTEVLAKSKLLNSLHLRLRILGARNDELGAIAAERSRLVNLAWQHHRNGAFEASIPIVLAQVDGIVHDATTTAASPRGKSFFTAQSGRRADVTDDETLAGLEFGLPAVRDWFSAAAVESAARGTASRHGVMHGRELAYDTETNSTKSFVLLLAIWEWANRRLDSLAGERQRARYDAHAGSDEVDENGWRLDRRGFVDTRDRLRRLALAETTYYRKRGRYGSTLDLLTTIETRELAGSAIEAHLLAGVEAWAAWLASEAGWIFAVGGKGGQTFYADGPQPIGSLPPASEWRMTDDGNWSGDCHW